MDKLQNLISHFMMKYLAVPKLPSVTEGKKTVACIGDSITFGAGVRGKRELTWEYHLENLLGSGYQVLNYGISGRTLLSTGDYPYTAEKQYAHSRKIMADVYLIMLGTNDSKPYNWNEAQFRKELSAFVKRYVNLENKPRVILMTPPSCYPDLKSGVVAFDINSGIIKNEICSIVNEIAGKYKLQVIDLHSFTGNHDGWFADGVHPNEEGNRQIADFVYRELGKKSA